MVSSHTCPSVPISTTANGMTRAKSRCGTYQRTGHHCPPLPKPTQRALIKLNSPFSSKLKAGVNKRGKQENEHSRYFQTGRLQWENTEMTASPRTIQPITCRPVDAPNLFGISRSTIYRWAKKGHLKIHKRAGMSFVLVQDVLDHIKGLGDQLGGHTPKTKISE